MLDKIVIGGVLVACLGGLHFVDRHYAIKFAVAETTLALTAKYDQGVKDELKKAKDKSDAMQAEADKDRDGKDEKITALNGKLSAALIELRNRPSRPSASNPANSSSGSKACTAGELYREDAEFLTREAARANSVLIERDYYYQQYEQVRNKINGTSK